MSVILPFPFVIVLGKVTVRFNLSQRRRDESTKQSQVKRWIGEEDEESASEKCRVTDRDPFRVMQQTESELGEVPIPRRGEDDEGGEHGEGKSSHLMKRRKHICLHRMF